MAVNHGKEGRVFRATGTGPLAGTVIANTTNWTLNAPSEFGEVRRHGDNWVTRVKGIQDWNGTVEAVLDLAGNQSLIANRHLGTLANAGGGTLLLALYATSATIPRYQGNIFVSDLNPSAPAGDLQTITFSFVGNGTLQQIT